MATTIQLKEKTVNRLKYFKAYSKESYDETLNKILDTLEEGALTNEAIADIQVGLKSMQQGKGESIEQIAKEFGVKL